MSSTRLLISPEAKYFAVGKIDRDQVEDYHRRKGMDLRHVERWLRPNLNYDPDQNEFIDKLMKKSTINRWTVS
jgi:hypothetical protein